MEGVREGRHLAAIMFVDMVGYSARMQDNEPRAIATVRALWNLVRPILAEHGGREVDLAGDGMLIEFPGALSAIRCALRIHAALHERGHAVPDADRVRTRAGVHLGDVEHRDGRIYGDGVNIAARIVGLSPPGGIALSRHVRDQLLNVLETAPVLLGSKTLKNIKTPVEIWCLPGPDCSAAEIAAARSAAQDEPGPTEGRSRRWSFGPAVLDERTLELTVGGERVALERKPLEVLRFLLHHAGEVVTKDEILAAAWPGRILSDSALSSCIARLREGLGDDAQAIIKTQYGYGYRLVTPVQVEATSAAAPPRFDFEAGDSPPLRPRWKLEQRLGTGGHGEAWLARHEKTREARVYKFALDGAALASLKREITIYRLLHDALPEREDFVAILDWNLEEPPYFLEIEHAGSDLVQWAESLGGIEKVPLEIRLKIAAQIAEALAAAHSVGVLHKDLKPSNVLVTGGADAPRIKLSDFGSGGVLDPERLESLGITRLGFTQTLKTDSTSGTPIYFAPEVIAGQPFTIQSDVYALGVILYQLAVADLRRPLATGWERDVADELLREDIVGATEGSPARRIGDAADVARALDALPERRAQRAADARNAQLATRAREEAERARETIGRLRARRRWLLALVVVLGLGVATSSGMYVAAQASRLEAEKSAATTRAVVEFLTRDVLSTEDLQTGLLRRDLTIREALDQAAAKVDERIAGDFDVAASVHLAIAKAYLALGDVDASHRQLDRAGTLQSSALGPIPDWKVAAWFLRTQGPRVLTGNIALSEDFCHSLGVYAQRGLIETIPGLVRQFRILAAICNMRGGYYERARQELDSMLAEALAANPPDRVAALLIENVLAALSYMQGDYRGAELHVRNEIGHSTAVHGEHHVHTLARRLQRAGPLALLGRFDEAEREISDIQEHATDDFPYPDRIVSHLASLRFEQGDLVAAQRHLDAFAQLVSQRQDPSDAPREMARRAVWLGAIQVRQGQPERAIATLRQALSVRAPPGDPVAEIEERNRIVETHAILADALRLTGDREGAWQAIDEARTHLRTMPDRHPALADIRRVQALLWHDEQRYGEAERAIREALEILQLRFGAQNWRTQRVRTELAELATAVR